MSHNQKDPQSQRSAQAPQTIVDRVLARAQERLARRQTVEALRRLREAPADAAEAAVSPLGTASAPVADPLVARLASELVPAITRSVLHEVDAALRGFEARVLRILREEFRRAPTDYATTDSDPESMRKLASLLDPESHDTDLGTGNALGFTFDELREQLENIMSKTELGQSAPNATSSAVEDKDKDKDEHEHEGQDENASSRAPTGVVSTEESADFVPFEDRAGMTPTQEISRDTLDRAKRESTHDLGDLLDEEPAALESASPVDNFEDDVEDGLGEGLEAFFDDPARGQLDEGAATSAAGSDENGEPNDAAAPGWVELSEDDMETGTVAPLEPELPLSATELDSTASSEGVKPPADPDHAVVDFDLQRFFEDGDGEEVAVAFVAEEGGEGGEIGEVGGLGDEGDQEELEEEVLTAAPSSTQEPASSEPETATVDEGRDELENRQLEVLETIADSLENSQSQVALRLEGLERSLGQRLGEVLGRLEELTSERMES